MLSCWQSLNDKLLAIGRLDDLVSLLTLQHLKIIKSRQKIVKSRQKLARKFANC